MGVQSYRLLVFTCDAEGCLAEARSEPLRWGKKGEPSGVPGGWTTPGGFAFCPAHAGYVARRDAKELPVGRLLLWRELKRRGFSPGDRLPRGAVRELAEASGLKPGTVNHYLFFWWRNIDEDYKQGEFRRLDERAARLDP